MKLTREHKSKHESLVTELAEAKEYLERIIGDFNSTMQHEWEKVKRAQEEMNTVIQSCNEFREEIQGKLGSHYEDQPDDWQQSEEGQKYGNLVESWSEELSDVDVEEPDEIQDPEVETDSFDNLPFE